MTSAQSSSDRQATMRIDDEGYIEGLGKQDMQFHHALAEIIDNSISAKIDDEDYFSKSSIPDQNFRVIVRINEIDAETVEVIVADSGSGISLSGLENEVFNIGRRTSKDGILNNHGMGLKNALAVLRREEDRNQFKIVTRQRDDPNLEDSEYWKIEGQLQTEMDITRTDQNEWMEGAQALDELDSGTRVHFRTSRDMVNSSYRKAEKFKTIMDALREHLGVIYRHYISREENKLILRWEDSEGDGESKAVEAIWPVFKDGTDADGRDWFEEDEINIKHEDQTYSVTYRRGIVDWEETRVEYGSEADERGSPFRIYYRNNQVTQGVDIVFFGRTLNTGLMVDIWDGSGISENKPKTTHNRFNDFVGELVIDDPKFSTTNNKMGIDQKSELWLRLKNKLNNEQKYHPRAHGKKEQELDIRTRIKQEIEGYEPIEKAVAPKSWENGVEVDIYAKAEGGDYVYEVKRGKIDPLAVYQLIMYWDSANRSKSVNLSQGIVTGKYITPNASEFIDIWNDRSDVNGNEYKIKFKALDKFHNV